MKSKGMHFRVKLEYKMHPKAVLSAMSREQQIQVRLHEQQGIKPTYKQQSVDARIAQLGSNSYHEEDDVMTEERETSLEAMEDRKKGFLC